MNEIKEINEIKIPKGVDRIAVKQHDDRIIFKFIPEKPKFKEGDFVYEDGRIMIVKNYPDNYYALIYPKLDMEPVYNRRYAPITHLSSLSFRYATEEEKQLLIDALKKDGKRWNAERMEIENIPQPKFKVGDVVRIKNGISSKTHRHTGSGFLKDMDEYVGKKFIISDIGNNADFGFYYSVRGNRWSYSEDWLEPYVEEPKKGDLAIFWDKETLPDGDAIIARYDCADIFDWAISHNSADGGVYNFAVKWDGTKEQFEKVLRGEI